MRGAAQDVQNKAIAAVDINLSLCALQHINPTASNNLLYLVLTPCGQQQCDTSCHAGRDPAALLLLQQQQHCGKKSHRVQQSAGQVER